MNYRRAALVFTSAALVAFSSARASAAPVHAKSISPPAWVYYAPDTPLDEVPIYGLSARAPYAMRALESEIERLYTHAKTLPSGHDRRTLQTRIYGLEKRLRPLWKEFDVSDWENLRSDVRAEWVSVQDSLPPAAVASPAISSSAPLAAKS